MKGKLNGNYRVKWHSNDFGDGRHESFFTYSQKDCLMHRFTATCEMIINHIALKGNTAEVEQMAADNGVIITERLPNSVIVKLHWVWIEKED